MPGTSGTDGWLPVAIRILAAVIVLPPTSQSVGVLHPRPPFNQVDARVDEQFSVDLVEPGDFAILVGDQCGPIEAAISQRPAETRRVFEVVAKMGCIDEEFLRDAAQVHAGSSEIALLSDGNPRAE